MQILTYASGFPMTRALKLQMRERLQRAFGRIGLPIQRVVIRLSDLNAERGGVDKRCLVQVQAGRMPDVVIEDVQADLGLAIGRAIERAARTFTRRLARSRRQVAHIQGETASASDQQSRHDRQEGEDR